MALRVAAVGEIAEDVYLAGEGPDGDHHLGGISANFARWARRAGAEASLYGAVGDDAAGARLCAELERDGLSAHLRVLAGATARQRIRLQGGGERLFCGFDAGVIGDYRLDDRDLQELARADVIAAPCSPESHGVFAQLWARGGTLVADFSQESLAGDDPAAWIAPHAGRLAIAFVGGRADHLAALAQLSRGGGPLIVLTAGAAGAWAIDGEHIAHQPSLVRAPVDTTGCGDAFQAGFTVARFSGASIAEALRAGAELAAEAASRRGAGPSQLFGPGCSPQVRSPL